ncbi:hypothetical protein PENTCL1PPCAC_17823 [Pristionchus entomophagus]|uniref:Nematode cuticle collagen N-terminal domain-containing protein n=1 Tax=Pristionchus entomophagus TaxID=358040 RepID=A0AAV5TN38_9BILA|nr:hypothetical protein PENTCL1PPCAC_17823 [Pristionchus entomophagus]
MLNSEISKSLEKNAFMAVGAWIGMIVITIASLTIAYMNMHTVLFKVNRRVQSMKEKMDMAEKLMGERKFPDELLGLLSNVLKIDKEADEAMTQSKMVGL